MFFQSGDSWESLGTLSPFPSEPEPPSPHLQPHWQLQRKGQGLKEQPPPRSGGPSGQDQRRGGPAELLLSRFHLLREKTEGCSLPAFSSHRRSVITSPGNKVSRVPLVAEKASLVTREPGTERVAEDLTANYHGSAKRFAQTEKPCPLLQVLLCYGETHVCSKTLQSVPAAPSAPRPWEGPPATFRTRFRAAAPRPADSPPRSARAELAPRPRRSPGLLLLVRLDVVVPAQRVAQVGGGRPGDRLEHGHVRLRRHEPAATVTQASAPGPSPGPAGRYRPLARPPSRGPRPQALPTRRPGARGSQRGKPRPRPAPRARPSPLDVAPVRQVIVEHLEAGSAPQIPEPHGAARRGAARSAAAEKGPQKAGKRLI